MKTMTHRKVPPISFTDTDRYRLAMLARFKGTTETGWLQRILKREFEKLERESA